MSAIWPVGPPKLMQPSFSQKRSAVRKVGWAGVAAGGSDDALMQWETDKWGPPLRQWPEGRRK